MDLKDLNKQFGGGVITGRELQTKREERLWYHTGNYRLNKAINHRGLGIPGGLMSEFYGDPQGGKTLLAMRTLASAQAQGGIGVLVDAEGAFDADFALKLGVDLDKIIYFGPTVSRTVDKEEDNMSPLTIGDAFMRIESSLKYISTVYGQWSPAVIVLDSLATLNNNADLGIEAEGTSFKEKKDGMPTANQGRKQIDIRQWMNRIRARVNASNTALLVLNHWVANIPSNPFERIPLSRQKIASGGSAPKFNARLRLEFTKTGNKVERLLDAKGREIGEVLHIFIDKNSIGPQHRHCDIDFYYESEGGVSMDPWSGYMEYLLEEGAVEVRDAKYYPTGMNPDDKKTKKFKSEDVEKMLETYPQLKEV